MSNEKIIQEMVRDIMWLKQETERLSKLSPLYDIKNVGLYADLTADQNNYALADYDVIKLQPTANRTIHGITNGYKGRTLFLMNISTTFTIALPNQSGSATVGNRIRTGSGGTITLGTRKTAVFIYDSDPIWTGTSLWILIYPDV